MERFLLVSDVGAGTITRAKRLPAWVPGFSVEIAVLPGSFSDGSVSVLTNVHDITLSNVTDAVSRRHEVTKTPEVFFFVPFVPFVTS